ncbi:tryptophan 2,3-dioxygenase-like isoform X1 [Hydractinia symbiolongicarpus]|uniref:tryptophan 2,3-dioxygenase-like isoform X1 n=1 Tax=Hydractinia symbiolongicarpus TaxID=13093 RepID=UPI00254B0A3E|nr:tryptophan 2,3-dioxygenase-like isoform X1 [Hydractinia symbiolongicarpus]
MACPYIHSVNGNNDEHEENLSYSAYLQLDSLLPSVKPLTDVHDEHLFIVVHQVYELWFKQIIHELDSVKELFLQTKRSDEFLVKNTMYKCSQAIDERSMLTVNSRLTRVVKILAILVEQIKILETMTPMDFADFRDALKPSSGFQSWQFRVIENKIGVKKENRINYNSTKYSDAFKDDEIRAKVLLAEDEPSIFNVVEAWLERTPGLKDDHFDFWQEFTDNCHNWFKDQKLKAETESNLRKREILMTEYQKNKENFEQVLIKENYEALRQKGDRNLSWQALQGALMIYYYRDEVLFHEPFQMLTLLMDIDSLITKWRSNHVLLVQRQLGTKTGTGGSSGYRYLRATVSDRYKAFLDLFNLSNYLIPRDYIPKLHINTRKRLASVCASAIQQTQNETSQT